MKAPVNVFALLCLVSTVQLALLVAPVRAQDEPASSDGEPTTSTSEPATRSKQVGADRWVPSLAAVSGITYQKWEGDVASPCSGCTNLPSSPIPNGVARPAAEGDDNDVTPIVGGQLELMTPELPIPLSPRFFAGGGLFAAFGTERKVANEGNVGTIESPLPQPFDTTPITEDQMIGQGAVTNAEIVDDWLYEAHAGVAFPFEFLGRQFRLKPSVGWVRYEIDVNGKVSDAECRDTGNSLRPNNCNVLTPAPLTGVLRTIELKSEDSGSFDGVGGGLDIDMDVFHIGPFSSSLFIGAHAYKILGEREIELGDSATFADTGVPGLAAATYASSHSLEIDPVFYRMAVGFRMSWVGFGATE
jgi:hypothetical protein